MPKAVASHRWPGGNTAIPAHYRWPDQVSATEALLKSGVVTVDVFAMRSDDAIEDPTAPLDVKKPELKPGQAITVDIVVANRGVGHAFPAELRDIFEAWLEFEAKDASGKVLMHSGAVKADGTLEPEAHAYRTTLVDTHGELSTKHDIWNTRAVALDRHIPAGRADIGRFTFIVPPGTLSPIVLTARLNYRRFNRNFTDWVSRDTPVMKSPVVKMSEHAVSLPLAGKRQPLRAAFLATDNSSLRKRWRAYGVALFDQQQYEGAASAFERARTLALVSSTDEASSDIDLAVTLMRMERAGSSQSVLDQAGRAIAHAIEINPEDGRARFYRALLNVKRFRYTEAIADLETLARKQPRDRQVWTQLAAIYLLQRRDQEAQAAYEQVLRIDPDDTEANFKLSGLFWRFGIYDLAKSSQDKFQPRHADTAGETLRRDYLRSHPELSATWPWRQFGDNPIGSLP
ncbi:MAG: tetratricopeptide repeat protein [Pyrinomonadaceae bacterium]